MSNRKSLIFQKSCLAMAVIALSACSTNPIQDDSAIGAVSDSLSRAGTKTRDFSISAWDKTIYLLGFSDVNPDAPTVHDKVNDQMLDEVDLALLEEDAILPPDFDRPSSDIVVVTSVDGLQTPTASPAPFQTPIKTSESSWLTSDELQTSTATTDGLEVDAQPKAIQSNIESLDDVTTASIDEATSVIPEAGIDVTAEEAGASNQYFHEVSSTETLWDIAKSTTGDANNWHTIADVNDLIQSTSVYPGQRLLIPAELVKPDLLSAQVDSGSETPTEAVEDIASANLADDVENLDLNVGVSDMGADLERLDIPAADALEEPDLAGMTDQIDQDNVELALGEGESLWDFARRTTGDATNWERIATHNGMNGEAAQLVYPGQMIAVPSAMLRTDGSTSEASTAAGNPVLEGATEVASIDEGSEESALRIIEATYQAEPVVATTLESDDTSVPAEMASRTPTLDEVIVSGTYYPKAIYHDTNFSSTLLMRVSPGTRLQVSHVDGPWLQVETERGTGYLHQRDIR